MWYLFLKYVAVGPLARWFLGLSWSGRENLPRHGPYVVAANHIAYLDPVGISMGVRPKLIYVAKASYYRKTSLPGRALAWFLRSIGQVPIDPTSARTSDPALATARRILQEGGVVGIFPEGTRSPDGRLYRGRTGVARLAIPLGVPVIPAGVRGTREVRLPGAGGGFRRGRVRIAYGEPIDTRAWQERAEDPLARREFTDLVMSRIAVLSGQDVAGRYPTREEIEGRDAPSGRPRSGAGRAGPDSDGVSGE